MPAAPRHGCRNPPAYQATPDSCRNPPAYRTTPAEAAITADGYRLPMRRWGDAERPQALVLALHGFNDYGNAFATLGPYLATQGILTFAYDQRGFGTTAQRGLWAGEERLIADLKTLTRLLRGRHPGIPLW